MARLPLPLCFEMLTCLAKHPVKLGRVVQFHSSLNHSEQRSVQNRMVSTQSIQQVNSAAHNSPKKRTRSLGARSTAMPRPKTLRTGAPRSSRSMTPLPRRSVDSAMRENCEHIHEQCPRVPRKPLTVTYHVHKRVEVLLQCLLTVRCLKHTALCACIYAVLSHIRNRAKTCEQFSKCCSHAL